MLGERGSSDVPGQVYVGAMRDWHIPVAEWQRYVRTPVRRDSGTLAPTVAVAPPVRRDYGAPGLRYTGAHDCGGVYGAPGLRCAGTTVCRDYGAPGLRCAEASSSTGEGPRRPCFLGQLGVLDRSGSTPAYLGPAMREAAQLPTASHRMALGAGTLLLTGPPSRVASTPRRLSARCVLEHSLVT